MITSDVISSWSLRFTSHEEPTSVLNTREKLTELTVQANSLIESASIEPERVLLVDEYHAFHGYTNGLTELIDAATEEIEVLIRLIKPSNALVLSTIYTTDRAIGLIEDVHILNNLTSAMLLRSPNGYNAENVETISYDRFFDGEDSYDLVIGFLGICSYLPNVLQKLLERVKQGGVLIMHNASDFGSAYRSDISVGTTAMTEIVDSGLFDVYHYASTVSLALCIKK
jgi:hypothetical protein